MDEENWKSKTLKEMKSANRVVESSIKLFGPNNVTSILDQEKLGDKLGAITSKLETYIGKTHELIEELEELRDREAGIEALCVNKIDIINVQTEAIIKKVNDNECKVKKKMEEVIRNAMLASGSSDIPSYMSLLQCNKINKEMKPQDHSILSDKIAEYCEKGSFLTHLPQVQYAIKFFIRQYQKKLPTFGNLFLPVLVGGFVDKTAGTLTAPDLDLGIQWELDEELTRHLVISPTDEGESGQYTLQVMEGHESDFKSLYKPFVVDIQNHGINDFALYVQDKINDAYVEKDSRTYLSSDLLRSQLEGLFQLMSYGDFSNFTRKDFSQTGAARTMAMDVKKMAREWILNCLLDFPEQYQHIFFEKFVDDSIYKVLPEVEVDYTPVFTIPYDHLPEDIKIWEQRDSWLLDQETIGNIKDAGGSLAAKSLENDASRSSIIWRLSLNAAPVMQKLTNHFENLEMKCSPKKVLRIIKDIKHVELNGSDKDFLKSYNVKQAMMWCIDEKPSISTEKDILVSTLLMILKFYEQGTFPSFLEPKRNLIFKLSINGKLELAQTKVREILNNLETCLDKIKDVQTQNRKGVSEVRSILAPMAPFLTLPVVLEKIAQKTSSDLCKNYFITKEREKRFYFEKTKSVEIVDKITNRIRTVSEVDRLHFVSKNFVDSILAYLTRKDDSDEQIVDEDTAEEDLPIDPQAAADLVDSIAAALPINNHAMGIINQVAAAVVPPIAEAVPAINHVLPNVNHLVNNILPVVNDIKNVLQLFCPSLQ